MTQKCLKIDYRSTKRESVLYEALRVIKYRYLLVYWDIGFCWRPLACALDFFFFQAEDGIRCRNVTGVQTCALPILAVAHSAPRAIAAARPETGEMRACGEADDGTEHTRDRRHGPPPGQAALADALHVLATHADHFAIPLGSCSLLSEHIGDPNHVFVGRFAHEGALDATGIRSHVRDQGHPALIAEVECQTGVRVWVWRQKRLVDVTGAQQRDRCHPPALCGSSHVKARTCPWPRRAAFPWPRRACCRTAPPVHPSLATGRASSARSLQGGRPTRDHRSTRSHTR